MIVLISSELNGKPFITVSKTVVDQFHWDILPYSPNAILIVLNTHRKENSAYRMVLIRSQISWLNEHKRNRGDLNANSSHVDLSEKF